MSATRTTLGLLAVALLAAPLAACGPEDDAPAPETTKAAPQGDATETPDANNSRRALELKYDVTLKDMLQGYYGNGREAPPPACTNMLQYQALFVKGAKITASQGIDRKDAVPVGYGVVTELKGDYGRCAVVVSFVGPGTSEGLDPNTPKGYEETLFLTGPNDEDLGACSPYFKTCANRVDDRGVRRSFNGR